MPSAEEYHTPYQLERLGSKLHNFFSIRIVYIFGNFGHFYLISVSFVSDGWTAEEHSQLQPKGRGFKSYFSVVP